MANSVGNIHVNLVVNSSQTSRFTSAANVIGRDSQRMRTALDGTSRSISALRAQTNYGMRSRMLQDMVRQATSANNAMGLLRSTMLGLAAVTGSSLTAAFAGTYLLQTADQARLLSNQLRTVTTDAENLSSVQERLYRMSQLTRSSMDATIMVYARTARAVEHLGYSQENLVRITETIQKAFSVGGASQQEAMGAAIQLSQGIASDRFSGEEYRSVSENAPVLLRAMADSLDVNIGKLREMAHAGKLTGDVVTQAILDASASVDADFEKIGVTVGQALTRVHNAFLMYIGDVDTSHGATRALAQGLSNLAENFDEVAHFAGLALTAVVAMGGGKILSAAGGGILANTVGQYAAIRKESSQRLADLKSQTDALNAQQATLRANVELQRQKVAGIVAQRHAVNATSRDIQRSHTLERREVARLTQMRLQALGVQRSQAAVAQQVAVAQRQASRASALSNVGRGVLGAFGGPTGIALTGAIFGIIQLGTKAAESAARTQSLRDELFELGMISSEVAGRVDEAAKSIEELTADELRQKMAALREEMTRQVEGQPWWEQIFAYDPNNLRNATGEIQRLVDMIDRADPRDGGDIRMLEGFGAAITDGAFLTGLLDIANAFANQTMTAEEAAAAHDRLVRTYPEISDKASALSLVIQNSIPFYDALIERSADLAEELATVFNQGDDRLASNLARQEASIKELATFLQQQDLLKGITDAQIALVNMSDEEKRLLDTMEKVRKAAEEEAEARGETLELTERQVEEGARAIIAAEDLAAALGRSREAMAEYAGQVNEIVRALDAMPDIGDNAEAVASAKRLVAEFLKGQRTAAELRSELSSLSGLNLSGGMVALIGKIQAAIPLAASLRRILNAATFGMAFGGTGSTEEDRAGVLGADLEERLRIAGMTPDQQARESLVSELMAGVDGFTRTKEEAAAAADEILRTRAETDALVESMESGGKATDEFADGMAELRREVKLSGMDKFWSEVAGTAESLGIATDEIDAFIAAIQSGGLDAAPQKFRDIADAMRDINANKIMRDLAYDTATMFASPWDKTIFDTLRDSGIAMDSVYGRLIAQQIRLNEGIKMGGEWGKEAFGGIARDLMNGVSWTEALNNAVGRLRDRMMDMAIDLIGNGIMGLLQGALGGLGGGMTGIVNGGPATYTPGVGWMRTGFATGTANTGGVRGEPRGIVHGQEAVIPLTGGGRVPVELRIGDFIASLVSSLGTRSVAGTVPMPNGGYGSLKVEILNESGQPLQTKEAGMRRENGIDIVTIVAGAMSQAAMGGKLSAFESLYGLQKAGA